MRVLFSIFFNIIILILLLFKGQLIASLVMILGYAIIVIPTGIITSELVKDSMKNVQTNTQSCPNCSTGKHRDKAEFCYKCGHLLNED